jgi:hypothetical protein
LQTLLNLQLALEEIMHKSSFADVNIIQILVDIIFLVLTFGISYLIAAQFTTLYEITEYFWILIVYVPIWVFFMAFQGMYDRTTF